jgi:hypothetical protein
MGRPTTCRRAQEASRSARWTAAHSAPPSPTVLGIYKLQTALHVPSPTPPSVPADYSKHPSRRPPSLPPPCNVFHFTQLQTALLPMAAHRLPSVLLALVALVASGSLVAARGGKRSCRGISLTCFLQPTSSLDTNGAPSAVSGKVDFAPMYDANMRRCRTHINGTLTGLFPAAAHGWHIHQFGDVSSRTGLATGTHFNPYNVRFCLSFPRLPFSARPYRDCPNTTPH